MKHLFLILLLSFNAYAQDRILKLESRHLAARVLAPEGITIKPNGSVVVGSNTEGRVHALKHKNKRLAHDGELFNYSTIKGWNPETSMVMGIAAENDDFIWVAISGLQGGCIAGLIPSKRESRLVKCGLGDVNGLVVGKKNQMLYVSAKDAGLTAQTGKIFGFSLKKLHAFYTFKIGLSTVARRDVFFELDMPNGLALSANEEFILATQTLEGKILGISLKTKKVKTLMKFNYNVWLDGLTYVPERELYIALDNKNARVHLFKLGGKMTSVDLVGINSERIGPASVAVWKDQVYITDLWEPSDLGVFMGATLMSKKSAITYHNAIYQIPLNELINE